MAIGATWAAGAPAAEPAAEAPAALVFVDTPTSPLAFRMRAELEALGLRVDIRPDHSVVADSLESAAQQARTVIAIQITSHLASVEIIILDRATGKTVRRTLPFGGDNSASGAELIVLRTVELLRASLLELHEPHPSRGDLPVEPRLRAIATPPPPPHLAPAPRPWSLAVGPALVASAPASAAFSLLLTLDWWASRSPLGASLGARFPLVAARLSGSEGSAELRVTSVSIGARTRFGALDARGWGAVGVGVSLDVLSMVGFGADGYLGRDTMALGVSPLVNLQGTVRLTELISLRAEGSAGCMGPKTTLQFAGRTLGSWGCPWATLGTTVVVSWP